MIDEDGPPCTCTKPETGHEDHCERLAWIFDTYHDKHKETTV